MAIISCGNRALPRDLDVQVQVSKPQVELTTDLSIVVAVVANPSQLEHGNGRIRYYTSIQAVEEDFANTTEAWKMANAFFSQSPRANRMAIAGAYTGAQTGFMRTGDIGAEADFLQVNDGAFGITIDDEQQDIAGVDFTSATDIDGVVAALQTAIRGASTEPEFASATVTHAENRITIASGTTGDGSSVSFLTSPSSGTDLSASGLLNAQRGTATVTDGYTPTGIQGELTLISEAARCAGNFVYGWTLDASYRDTTAQQEASEWVQSRTAILGVVSNSQTALDSASTGDIGAFLENRGDIRTVALWSDSINEYPEVALLSYMLHVNYAAPDSTVTAKFKDLNGITPAGITETQLTVLEGKRYNVLTRVGNNSRTTRDGVNSNPNWFMDDLINLDNFKEELQVSVFNAFLRNRKLPYTIDGVNKLRQAVRIIGDRYVLNGTFADRPTTNAFGEVETLPAFAITIPPLSQTTAADRAARVGPPITIDAQLAGAIHEVSISVNAFN